MATRAVRRRPWNDGGDCVDIDTSTAWLEFETGKNMAPELADPPESTSHRF